MAEKYHKTPAQIILHWHVQMGFIVIPGSRSPKHIRENIEVYDFRLTDEEMAEIAALDKGERFYNRKDEDLAKWATMEPEWEEA